MKRMEAQKQHEIAMAQWFAIQQSKDIAILAAAEAFGLGAERTKRFADTYDKVFDRYAVMVDEDTKDIEYSKFKLDQALQAVCGEYFVPWEERYK